MTLLRIAKLAGVSTSTVSRVINSHPRVSASTAESVRRVMQELDFTPATRKPRGRNGNGHRTRAATVAMLVFGTSGSQTVPAFEQLLRGVSFATADNDLNLIFSFVSDPRGLPPKILERRVDGLLLHGEQPGEAVQKQLNRLPTVWMMANRERPAWGDQVMPDNTVIGELAARYLVSRGHRDVAFLSTSWGPWAFDVRGLSFVRMARECGAQAQVLHGPVDRPDDLWNCGDVASVAETLVEQLAALEPRPRGLFIAEDRQVPAFYAALERRGIAIGRDRDVEIISCNNERPHLAGLEPVPATIDICAELIGRRAVEQLMWRLQNADGAARIRAMIEPVLIESPA